MKGYTASKVTAIALFDKWWSFNNNTRTFMSGILQEVMSDSFYIVVIVPLCVTQQITNDIS